MDAVVLAAGEGKRLHPLTLTRPKPMIPVAGKPILAWVLDGLKKAGVKKAVVVVGYRREIIEGYFGSSYDGVTLEYVVQKKQTGTGDAVARAEGRVKGDFLVVNGDVIVDSSDVKAFAAVKGGDAALCVSEVQDPSRFGVVEVVGGRIKSLVEKPERPKSNLVNAGLYRFNEDVFKRLSSVGTSPRGEIELTDAVRDIIKDGDVKAYRLVNKPLEVGLPWDMLNVNEKLMKDQTFQVSKKAELEEHATLKGPVSVGEGTRIRSGVYVEGPVLIGKNCDLGPNCYIRPYTVIGDKCRVGNAVEIKNSIIMNHTHVGHLSYVGDSVIGEHCNFGAGTKVANLRFDDGEVHVEIQGKMMGSGRRKLGCIMGDYVKTGINVSIMPGRCIYPHATVEAGSVVKHNITAQEPQN
ncbi:Bifunctional protein GlmU [uncultured archaeon]|nr:Bifunctional protein GlmU [uncultured archaeon]